MILVKANDMNDLAFVALNEFQNSIRWTGDKPLVKGLRSFGYDRVILTNEIVNLRNTLENNKKSHFNA